MRSRRGVWTSCVLAVVWGLLPGHAQTVVDAGTTAELRAMSKMAAVVFSGQVVAIRRGESIVEIDFAVEDAVRGVDAGAYTLREWAGLWVAGNDPLHLGQHYLMLLHTPGEAGLSSPVGGVDGAIPILGGDAAAGGVGRGVDLRWVTTRAVRALPVAVVETRAIGVDALEARPGGGADSGRTPYAAVVGLLRDSEKAHAAQ